MPQPAERIQPWSSDPIGYEFPREGGTRIEFLHESPPHERVRHYAYNSTSRKPSVGLNPFINDLFSSYAQEWRTKAEHLSSIKKMVAISSYQQIIGLGKPAIPLILRELDERPNFWFTALREITGQWHIGEGQDFKGAREAWLAWGRGLGLI
jgi:hypothetical protein